jgi:hypothetical protein
MAVIENSKLLLQGLFALVFFIHFFSQSTSLAKSFLLISPGNVVKLRNQRSWRSAKT